MTSSELLKKIHSAAGAIAVQGLSLGVIVVDRDLLVIHWNGWMEKHSGIREQDIIGYSLLERWPAIREQGNDGYLIDCVERRRTVLLSPLLHQYFLPLTLVRDQQAVQMLQSVKIYPFLDGEDCLGAIIIIQDMTEGILHEREIQRLTRILDGIRNFNKLMVRVSNEDDLLNGACDILVHSIGYPFAWIGFLRENSSGPTMVAAAPRSAVPYEIINSGGNPGCDETCPVLQNNAKDRRWNQILTPDHGELFSRACLYLDSTSNFCQVCCLPLRSQDHTIGVLHILSEDQKPFHAEELQLLEEYAYDIDYAVETLRDRKRRKAAEAALRENEQRLRQSQKMEAIGVLAGGIAHDFNNILYPIIGFSEMLEDEIAKDAPEREYIDEVLKAAYRARDLVRQILAFSRQSDQTPEPVFVASIVKESLQLMRASLPSSIEIRADIDKHCGCVLTDPTHIYQVVMNLCANAFQAMEETGGILDISLREKLPVEEDGHGNQSFIRLSVKDTGVGIDPETKERIFEPYFTTKERGKGTGMGLSVVHGIVESMGGQIEVVSSPGQGTAFHIDMPKKKTLSETAPGIQAHTPSYQGARGTERILLVDDEIQNLKMMQAMLEGLGYAVTKAQNGWEALERFRDASGDFDLVITDLTMPGLSGEDLASELTRIQPETPIILCTGYREKITLNKARSLGIRQLLDKPMSNQLLAEAVRNVLDN